MTNVWRLFTTEQLVILRRGLIRFLADERKVWRSSEGGQARQNARIAEADKMIAEIDQVARGD